MKKQYVYFMIGLVAIRIPKEIYDTRAPYDEVIEAMEWHPMKRGISYRFVKNDISELVSREDNVYAYEPTTLEEILKDRAAFLNAILEEFPEEEEEVRFDFYDYEAEERGDNDPPWNNDDDDDDTADA